MSNVDIAQGIYDAFGRGDIETVLAAMHPTVQWHQAEGNPYQPDGSVWIGPQTVLEKLMMRIGAEWDGFTISIRVLHDAGEHVIMEGRYRATYKATGKRLDAQVCHVLRIQEGKLVGFQQYTDTGQLQAVVAG